MARARARTRRDSGVASGPLGRPGSSRVGCIWVYGCVRGTVVFIFGV